MLTRNPLPPPQTRWWVRVTGEQFTRYELAGSNPADWSLEARRLAGVQDGDGVSDDWIEYRDPARRVYRAAWFVDDQLQGCLYAAPTPSLPERAWLARDVRRSETRRSRARQSARGSCAGRFRRGGAGVFLFWHRAQSNCCLRAGAGFRGHARRDRQAPQVRHQLRLLPRRDPGHRLGHGARRAGEARCRFATRQCLKLMRLCSGCQKTFFTAALRRCNESWASNVSGISRQP